MSTLTKVENYITLRTAYQGYFNDVSAASTTANPMLGAAAAAPNPGADPGADPGPNPGDDGERYSPSPSSPLKHRPLQQGAMERSHPAGPACPGVHSRFAMTLAPRLLDAHDLVVSLSRVEFAVVCAMTGAALGMLLALLLLRDRR